MAGCYIRVSWPDGRSLDIEDNSTTTAPAFRTEAEAETWINTESVSWLRRLSSSGHQLV
jgi:hypothetical protein